MNRDQKELYAPRKDHGKKGDSKSKFLRRAEKKLKARQNGQFQDNPGAGLHTIKPGSMNPRH